MWKEVAAEHPAVVVTTGDSIQGGSDATAEQEWRAVARIWSRIPLYLVPGNHDISSTATEQLFRKYSGHPLQYSFDYEDAHFTVLDNSRSDELSPGDLRFLEADLKAHASAPVKFVLSHRPSWLIPVALRNTNFPLHRLAKQYGVQYVVAGHLHQMLHFELEGVTYISMPSSGGHLRLSKAYEDGWFFGHARVAVTGRGIDFRIEEVNAPRGQGRVTKATDWGMTGLVHRAAGGSRSEGMPAK